MCGGAGPHPEWTYWLKGRWLKVALRGSWVLLVCCVLFSLAPCLVYLVAEHYAALLGLVFVLGALVCLAYWFPWSSVVSWEIVVNFIVDPKFAKNEKKRNRAPNPARSVSRSSVINFSHIRHQYQNRYTFCFFFTLLDISKNRNIHPGLGDNNISFQDHFPLFQFCTIRILFLNS